MDWKGTIGTLAPTLATALGGPVAGLAVGALCSVFGIETTDKSEEAINTEVAQAVLKMTPAQALELKAADKKFLIDMRKLEVDVYNINHEEKASARKMYKTKGMENKLPQMVLGTIILLGSFCLFWFVLSGNVSDTIDGIMVGTIIGAAISELKNLTGFYFGSSVQEHTKKEVESK